MRKPKYVHKYLTAPAILAEVSLSKVSTNLHSVRGGEIGRGQASHAEGRELDSRPSQGKDLENVCLSLPNRVLGIRLGHWLAKCLDNMTGWGIRLWCWQPGLTGGQHYKVAFRVHHHKTRPVLI